MLNLPGVKEDVGLIGVHFRGHFIELVPWNGSVEWDVAPWGRCELVLCHHRALQQTRAALISFSCH